jgi:4-aminobutyrate aminotransferase
MAFPHGVPAEGEGDTNQSPRRHAWVAAHLDAATRELVERDARVFLKQSVSTPCLSAVRRAEGIWIEDLQGRRFLDFHGNNVHHIGYSHPRLLEALHRQLDVLTFAPRRYTSEPAVELAEKLVKVTPATLERVLFAPSGSDAVEMALAYARAATGRFKTISFWDSYHGAGFAARSIGGEAMFRSGPIGPLLAGTEHVPPFGDYRNAWGVTAGSAELCARTIRYVLEREADIAAVVAEPIRAIAAVPPAGFWRAVRQACDEFGALLIFDEIPTGLGKSGRMFACEHDGVIPDILVLGKALGGGVLPLAAMVTRPELDVCGAYAFGHYTHEKNPLLARAGLTTLQIIEEEGLVENAARMGRLGLEKLQAMMDRHPLIGDVRGQGCLLAVELVSNRDSRKPAPAAADSVLYKALGRGLNFKTAMGNVLSLTPPLIVTESQMDAALEILEVSIGEVEQELGML